ncbi:MAG: AraC family transcriptional regulator [Gammaproteobacteria bacterium]|nr:AraC family transcriptional regulator [Gammaproteobacteria bacterium]
MRIVSALILCIFMSLGMVQPFASAADAPAATPSDKPDAAKAADEEARKHTSTLDTRIQGLKKEVLDLNRDLFLLEEDLLFPANTQFSVFVSMDIGLLFDLDSVELKLNDKTVASHLYTEREVAALKRGGVQRLYTGNMTSGEHEFIAYFTGRGPKNRDYKRATTIKVSKGPDPQYVELKISDSTAKYQPEFKVKVWDAQ